MIDSGKKILVVDDEQPMREILAESLGDDGFIVDDAPDVATARGLTSQNQYDLVVTDLNMPGENGIELIRHVRRHCISTGIVVITAFPDQGKVRLIDELEVDSFIIKPFTIKQLKFSVLGALERHRVARELSDKHKGQQSWFEMGIAGVSPYIHQLRTQVRLMASGDFPVLILGESGTGKEVVAHAIHDESARKKQNLITINCGAIPRHLEESEFFGHAKGAFTGAHSSKIGFLEGGNHSTVFLDEIAELSPEVQAKLLRVLDTGEFTRLGEIEPHKVDIRILSATNRNLEEMVAAGAFRKDLYYRLKGASITTIPLCDHKQDIPSLVTHFLGAFYDGKEITADALAMLTEYNWPGNVRELKHAIGLLCSAAKSVKRINSSIVAGILKKEQPDGPEVPYAQARAKFEKDYFCSMLQKHAGNVSRVAKESGIHRPNLIRKLKELGIETESFRLKT